MDWRELTDSEQGLLNLLLSARFEGSEAIVNQLRGARVRTLDAEGSLTFNVSSPERAAVRYRVPIEAEAMDRDGTAVHMLLHVVEGMLSELEFYKDDSSRIIELPPPGQWRVIQLQ